MSFDGEYLRKVYLHVQKAKRGKPFEHIFYPPYLSRSDFLLDIRCGSDVALLSALRKVSYAVGIDIDPDVLKIAKKNLGRFNNNVELVRANAFLLPFKSCCFEKIFVFDVLKHLRFPSVLVNEIKRVTKRGGGLILRIPLPTYIHVSSVLLRSF